MTTPEAALLAGPLQDTGDDELIANVRPPKWRNPSPLNPYHLLIVGAGPAGLVAAKAAASLGARVALIERDRLGGDSLNYASVPTKTLIRTARNYADMRGAAGFGGKAPADIPVDFPLAMDRVRRIRTQISRANSASRLSEMGIDLFFGEASFLSPATVDGGRCYIEFSKGHDRHGLKS